MSASSLVRPVRSVPNMMTTLPDAAVIGDVVGQVGGRQQGALAQLPHAGGGAGHDHRVADRLVQGVDHQRVFQDVLGAVGQGAGAASLGVQGSISRRCFRPIVFMARQAAPMFIGSVVRLSTTTTLSRLAAALAGFDGLGSVVVHGFMLAGVGGWFWVIM